MTTSIRTLSLLSCLAVLSFASSCGKSGKDGETPTDCGGHGTLHEGHCHCDTGYLYDGKTCVAPESITEICAEHEHETGDAGTTGDAAEEHHHEACLCPSTGECHCEEGTVETLGTKKYCVPELHHE